VTKPMVSVSEVGEAKLVSLSGEIDLSNAPEVGRAITASRPGWWWARPARSG
jgi:hypothetical protein